MVIRNNGINIITNNIAWLCDKKIWNKTLSFNCIGQELREKPKGNEGRKKDIGKGERERKRAGRERECIRIREGVYIDKIIT